MHLAALQWPPVERAYSVSCYETHREIAFYTTLVMRCSIQTSQNQSLACTCYRRLTTDTMLGLLDATPEVNGEPGILCNATAQVLPLRMLNYGAPGLSKTNSPPQFEANASHGHQANAQNLLVSFQRQIRL